MTLQDYKKAVTRLFYDMINADGIIEDDEITFLEELKRKYGISVDDIARAHQITTAEAIKILKDWKLTEETKPDFSYEKYTADNAFKDIDAISGCDSDRDINEAKLLAALHLCLLTENGQPVYDAIPIKYRETKLRFARREVLYLSSEPHPEIDEVIKRSKKYIECLLAIYGYDFIYLPHVIDFLAKKADNHLLKPILMFSKPLYLKEGDDAERFVSEIQSISTESFTRDFVRDAGLVENLKPSLLIKLKTTTVHEKDDKGEWRPVKYTDFLALPIQCSVEYTARLLPERILGFTQEITSLVRRQLNEKLYCKGIHQTLIDYTVEKSVSESIDSITIKRWGQRKGIIFNGLHNPFVSLQPKELAVYMMMILLSMSESSKGLPMFSPRRMIQDIHSMYKTVYSGRGNTIPELYNALNVQISNIRSKIADRLSVMDLSTYSPEDLDGCYHLKINPDNIWVQDTNDVQKKVSLRTWIQDKGLKDLIDKLDS